MCLLVVAQLVQRVSVPEVDVPLRRVELQCAAVERGAAAHREHVRECQVRRRPARVQTDGLHLGVQRRGVGDLRPGARPRHSLPVGAARLWGPTRLRSATGSLESPPLEVRLTSGGTAKTALSPQAAARSQ